MSREWLALVEMGKENEKFSPSLLFLHQASASRYDSLHPLSIVLCIAVASAFVALLLSKAAAVAPVSSLFLSPNSWYIVEKYDLSEVVVLLVSMASFKVCCYCGIRTGYRLYSQRRRYSLLDSQWICSMASAQMKSAR